MVLKLGVTTGSIEADVIKTSSLLNADGNPYGEWEIIAFTETSSSVASQNFDITGAEYTKYDDIRFHGSQITTVTDGVNFLAYVSKDNAATYRTDYRDLIARSTDATTNFTHSYSASRGNIEIMQGTGNDAWARHWLDFICIDPFVSKSDHMYEHVAGWWADDVALLAGTQRRRH